MTPLGRGYSGILETQQDRNNQFTILHEEDTVGNTNFHEGNHVTMNNHQPNNKETVDD